MERGQTRRRYLLAVGAAGASGLAGCQTPLDGEAVSEGDDVDEDDPADESGPAADVDPPAGTGPDGIEDPETLVGATREAMAEADYESTNLLRTTGSSDSEITQHVWSSLADERRYLVFDGDAETNRIYTEDGRRYGRQERDGTVEYSASDLPRPFAEVHAPEQLSGTESLGGILRDGEYTPTETTTKYGRRLVRFDLEAGVAQSDAMTVADAAGYVLVSDDSVVFDAELTLDLESEDGESLSIDRSFGLPQLGSVTVDRPDWYAEAAEAGTPTPEPMLREVRIGPEGSLELDPEELTVTPGTTVRWVWGSDDHNLVPQSQPSESEWTGHSEIEDEGFTYEHTFTVEGEYVYACEPHLSVGEEGRIVVRD